MAGGKLNQRLALQLAKMGCCYSLLLTEDRKLIAILKHYDVFDSSQFLKMKAALAYKKAYILDENGKKG